MSSRTRKNVGVLGLGIIGQRVVSNLREHGFHVFVWNRTPRPVPNFVGPPAEVADRAFPDLRSDDTRCCKWCSDTRPDREPRGEGPLHGFAYRFARRCLVERRAGNFWIAVTEQDARKGELVYYLVGIFCVAAARPFLKRAQEIIGSASGRRYHSKLRRKCPARACRRRRNPGTRLESAA